MWTVRITNALLQALLAANPGTALDRAIVTFMLNKIFENEHAGYVTISSRVAKRIDNIVPLNWLSKDLD